MKKKRLSSRIFTSICTVSLVVFAAVLIVIIAAFDGYFTDTQKKQLKNETILAAGGAASGGLEYFDNLPGELDDFRITYIGSDGSVIYDSSSSDVSSMDNHLSRPEVRDALLYGYGENERRSDTLSVRMIYSAVRLSDGSVLRLSYEEITAWRVVLSILPLIAGMVAVAVVVSLLLAGILTKHIVGPMDTLDLDDPLSNDIYEELSGLMNRIDLQQRELRADRTALERNEKIREEFTANVSHEMKTPLQTISGYAEIMQAGIVKPEDIRPFANRIYQESHRLSALVEDIIDLTKLDTASESDYSLSETDIYQAASNVADSLQDAAQAEGIEIMLTGGSAVIYSESELLYSIIYNLCDNAIKYNHPGGSICIEVRKEKDFAVLKVSDTGVGIPAEALDRIFERFYRVDKSRSREVGGTGLGLSIVKHACLILNAEVTVTSTVGKGSEFTVRFPL